MVVGYLEKYLSCRVRLGTETKIVSLSAKELTTPFLISFVNFEISLEMWIIGMCVLFHYEILMSCISKSSLGYRNKDNFVFCNIAYTFFAFWCFLSYYLEFIDAYLEKYELKRIRIRTKIKTIPSDIKQFLTYF